MPLVLSVRRLIDFGFAKVLRTGAKTFTLCGTPQYLAPEIVTSAGHGLSVDWWAFGVLMYEMLHGHTPFDGEEGSNSPTLPCTTLVLPPPPPLNALDPLTRSPAHPSPLSPGPSSMSIYQNIMGGKVTYSPAMRPAARELMQKLLVANPSKRLTFQAIKKEERAQARTKAGQRPHARRIRPCRRLFRPKRPSQPPQLDRLRRAVTSKLRLRLSLLAAALPGRRL